MTPEPVYVRVRIQHAMAIGHLADDSGDFVWAMCRRGLQAAAGKAFHTGDKPLFRVTVEWVDEEAERLNRQAAGEAQSES